MVKTILKELNKDGLLNHVGKFLAEQPEKFTETFNNMEERFRGLNQSNIRKIITLGSLMDYHDNLPVTNVIDDWVAEEEQKFMGLIVALDHMISGNMLGLDSSRSSVVVDEEAIKKLDGLEIKAELDYGCFMAVAIFKISFSYEGFSKVYCKIDQITEDGDIIMGVYKGEWLGLKHLINELDRIGLRFISECIKSNLL